MTALTKEIRVSEHVLDSRDWRAADLPKRGGQGGQVPRTAAALITVAVPDDTLSDDEYCVQDTRDSEEARKPKDGVEVVDVGVHGTPDLRAADVSQTEDAVKNAQSGCAIGDRGNVRHGAVQPQVETLVSAKEPIDGAPKQMILRGEMIGIV